MGLTILPNVTGSILVSAFSVYEKITVGLVEIPKVDTFQGSSSLKSPRAQHRDESQSLSESSKAYLAMIRDISSADVNDAPRSCF